MLAIVTTKFIRTAAECTKIEWMRWPMCVGKIMLLTENFQAIAVGPERNVSDLVISNLVEYRIWNCICPVHGFWNFFKTWPIITSHEVLRWVISTACYLPSCWNFNVEPRCNLCVYFQKDAIEASWNNHNNYFLNFIKRFLFKINHLLICLGAIV